MLFWRLAPCSNADLQPAPVLLHPFYFVHHVRAPAIRGLGLSDVAAVPSHALLMAVHI